MIETINAVPTPQALLIELGCEELPAILLTDLAHSLAQLLSAALEKLGLSFSQPISYHTPRRIAVYIAGLDALQAPQTIERRGPAIAAGLDASGAPSRALLGFAQSVGVSVDALERLETEKGSWFVYKATLAGQSTATLLPSLITEVLHALPVAKPMRWGAGDTAFLRPVHWLLALFGAEVIASDAFGVSADRLTYGHRFHAPETISIAHADAYARELRTAYVEPDALIRRTQILAQSAQLAATQNGVLRVPAALLDEVANLTEWPVPILCALPAEFMDLPPATIVTTIETHQRYFPIYASNQARAALLPAFIGVANIDSKDPGEIRKGYERVVRPRLADAKFFFDLDRKTPLETFQTQLKTVTFQQKLGTVWDKSVRVAALAKRFAADFSADPANAETAALLAKCDLMSRMVGEFPELQGTMGSTYAKATHGTAISAALEEVYWPRQAGQPIAETALGRLLAVCERLDTIAGIFAVGLKPTGNKDAFALRRAALGMARTLIESGTGFDIRSAINEALAQLPASAQAKPSLGEEIYSFIIERLRAYYQDQNIASELLDAVAIQKPSDLLDFDQRLRACVAFKALPESTALVAANKRIRNILRKARELDPAIVLDAPASSNLFQVDAEHVLANAVQSAASDTLPLLANQQYVDALLRLSALQAPVDAYFDAVMVMDDDLNVRLNRLRALNQLSELFLKIADVSVLA